MCLVGDRFLFRLVLVQSQHTHIHLSPLLASEFMLPFLRISVLDLNTPCRRCWHRRIFYSFLLSVPIHLAASFLFYSRLAAQSCGAGQILKESSAPLKKWGRRAGAQPDMCSFHPEILRYNGQRRSHSAQCQRRMYIVEGVEYLESSNILMQLGTLS